MMSITFKRPRKSGLSKRTFRFEPLEQRTLLSVTTPAMEIFSASPAVFQANEGQWADESVQYAFFGDGANVLHTDAGPVFQLFQKEEVVGSDGAAETITNSTQFAVTFDGANAATPVGLDEASTVFNYMVGDQADWRTGVAGYKTVAYDELYNGIDLYTWGRRDNLKYEFHVAPGVDYTQVQLTYNGVEGLSLDATGNLHIQTALGEVVDDAPYVYQEINGQQVEIASHFELVDADTCTFVVAGQYDPTQELILDPSVGWSRFIGGTDADWGLAIDTDSNGDILLTGGTQSSDVSVTNAPGHNPGTVHGEYHGGTNDVLVAKVWGSGGTSNNVEHFTGDIAWISYLGGTGGDGGAEADNNEEGQLIAVDSENNAVITGRAASPEFLGTLQEIGWDWETMPPGYPDTLPFVAKVSGANGALIWAEPLVGGTEDYGGTLSGEPTGLAVDSSGDVLLTGSGYPLDHSQEFFNAGAAHAYWLKLAGYSRETITAGQQLGFTYLEINGGNPAWDGDWVQNRDTEQWEWKPCHDDAYGVAIGVDNYGNSYIAGTLDDYWASHPDWKICDVFVAKITSAGTPGWIHILRGHNQDCLEEEPYSSDRVQFDDRPTAIAVHPDGEYVVLVGETSSLTYSGTYGTQTVEFTGITGCDNLDPASNLHFDENAVANGYTAYSDAFMSKVSAAGVEWTRYLGDVNSDTGLAVDLCLSDIAVVLGAAGNGYLPENDGGLFAASVYVGPELPPTPSTPKSGDILWADRLRGTESCDSPEKYAAIAMDTRGNAYVTGTTDASLDDPPSDYALAGLEGYYPYPSNGNYYQAGYYHGGGDTYVMKINNAGRMPPPGPDEPDKIGDLNLDGFVGGADLDIVRANWGRNDVPPGDISQGDCSGDGSVGAADLDIVRATWGDPLDPPPQAPAVPLGVTAMQRVAVDNSSVQDLANYVTQDLVYDTGNAYWLSAQLAIDLTPGSTIYYHGDPPGPTDPMPTPPTPQEIQSDPAIAFRTYFSADGEVPAANGGAVDLAQDPAAAFDTTSFHQCWFYCSEDLSGELQLARVTLSNNASGTWSMWATAYDGSKTLTTLFRGTITNGVMDIDPLPRVVAVGLSSTSQSWEAGVIDVAEWTDTTAPWTGINQIVIDFDEVVYGTIDDVTVLKGEGEQQEEVPLSSLTGSGTTQFVVTLTSALWADDDYQITISDSIYDADGNYLDGEANPSPGASGDGEEGGDWSQTLSLRPCDLNGDGYVGAEDYLTLTSHWGATVDPGDRTAGDVNGSGTVSGADSDAMMAHYADGDLPTGPGTPASIHRLAVENVDNSGILTNKVTQDLIYTAVTAFKGAELRVTLTAGSIYQSGYGGTYAPNPMSVQNYPSLAFDTYVTAGGYGIPVSTWRGAVDIGGNETAVFSTSAINQMWYSTDGPTGDVQLARVTLSNDADGTWSMWITNEDGEKSIIVGTIEDGVMIANPLPQAVAVGLSSTDEDWDAGVIDSAEWAYITVPWAGIDQIVIDFDEPVYGTIDDVIVYDGEYNELDLTSLTGSGTTQLTVTLDDPLASDDQYHIVLSDNIVDADDNLLDGEPYTGIVSGNGVEGGHWSRVIDMLLADFNGDSFVGGEDYLAIVDNWGASVTPGDRAAGDVDGDGVIGGADLTAIVAQYGEGGVPTGPGQTTGTENLTVDDVDNSSVQELADYVTQDLLFATETDWLAAQLSLDLTSGSIYQNAYGSNTPPNPALFQYYPSLEFDTYLSAGGYGETLSVAGGAVDLGQDAAGAFSTSAINKLWYSTDGDSGELQLARVTLSDDADGTWSMWIRAEDGGITVLTGVIEDGVIIADPLPRVIAVGLSSTDANWDAGVIDSAEWAASTVPWTGIDQIVIDFDEAVYGTLSDIAVYDSQENELDVASLAGSGTTRFTITLDDPLTADDQYRVVVSDNVEDADGHYLDGEPNALLPSGDNVEGGNWSQEMNLVVCDFNGDGYVGGEDHIAVAENYGETVTAGDRAAGDVNGDGSVNSSDLDALQAHWADGTLPTGPATPINTDDLTIEFVDNSSAEELADYITQDLIFDATSDWLGAQLIVNLTSGSIYQDALGSYTPPNPALFETYPSLEFDTYLSADGYGNSFSTGGGAVDLGGNSSLACDASEIDAFWYNTTEETGDLQLARVSLSTDAVGTWSMWALSEGGEKSLISGVIIDGMMIIRS